MQSMGTDPGSTTSHIREAGVDGACYRGVGAADITGFGERVGFAEAAFGAWEGAETAGVGRIIFGIAAAHDSDERE